MRVADERQRVSRRAGLLAACSVASPGARPVAITSQRWADRSDLATGWRRGATDSLVGEVPRTWWPAAEGGWVDPR